MILVQMLVYIVYAAKTKNCLVQAFEPCFFNTDHLVKNIYRNSLNNNINVFPVVLGNMDKTISSTHLILCQVMLYLRLILRVYQLIFL